MVDRERVLNVRLSDEEVQMLTAIAEQLGLSQSDCVRQWIRRTFAEMFSPRPKSKPKKR